MDARHANFYRILFGENPKADEILAALNLTVEDIERYRDASIYTVPDLDDYGIPEKEAGRRYMVITTRTGGNNRAEYHNRALTHHPLFEWTEDDEYDSTYADYYFRIPDASEAEQPASAPDAE